MTVVMEHCDDKCHGAFDDKGVEHCDEKSMDNCDYERHGAL